MSAPNQSLAQAPHPIDETVDQFFHQLVIEFSDKEADQKTKAPARLVQDYTPLVTSLESELAEAYWSTVGVQAFSGNQVPFVINNDGRLSHDAAQLFYANCLETEASESQIRVLELGAGTGLFSRYFLDAFKNMCEAGGRDFYDRLMYFVSDGSPRTVQQWQQWDQFAAHSSHVTIGRCDALNPSRLHISPDQSIQIDGLRTVFTNYILDVLPAAVVRSHEGQPQHLCVRTILEDEADPSRLDQEFDADTVCRLAASSSREDRVKLLPVLDALRFDTAFVAIGADSPPYLAEVLEFGKGMDRMLLNFGAVDCLRNCLKLLRDDGFIQINDYGPTNESDVAKFGTATRFGSSIATGVNFPFLEYYFADRAHVLTPPNDEKRSIHSRAILKTNLEQTRQTFFTCFDNPRWHWETDNSAISRARKLVLTGKPSEALANFRQALQEDPGNWCVMGEAAEFLIRTGDAVHGIELARIALDRNPWYSAWLWNTLGDGLYALEQFREAQNAYEAATGVNPTDVAANFNLSFVYGRAGRHRDALEALAKALIHDFAGEFRERIIEQQQNIMRSLSMRWTMQQIRRYQRAAAFE